MITPASYCFVHGLRCERFDATELGDIWLAGVQLARLYQLHRSMALGCPGETFLGEGTHRLGSELKRVGNGDHGS